MLVTEYDTTTTDKIQYENHHEYVDIHLLINGQEDIAYAAAIDLETVKSYDLEQDYELLEGKGNLLALCKDFFVIFFLGKAHFPGLADCKAISSNRKLIFKVKYINYAL